MWVGVLDTSARGSGKPFGIKQSQRSLPDTAVVHTGLVAKYPPYIICIYTANKAGSECSVYKRMYICSVHVNIMLDTHP